MRGFSAVSLLLIDEAARVSDDLYKAVRPMLAVSDGDLWLMSTPCGQRGFFYEEWANGGERWERVRAPAAECARIPARFWRRSGQTMGERWFRQEYLLRVCGSGDGVFRPGAGRAGVARRSEAAGCSDGSEMRILESTSDYFVGVDLGQKQRFYGGGVVERAEEMYDVRTAVTWERKGRRGIGCGIWSGCRWGRRIRRWWSGCARWSSEPKLTGRCELVVDATGVGGAGGGLAAGGAAGVRDGAGDDHGRGCGDEYGRDGVEGAEAGPDDRAAGDV